MKKSIDLPILIASQSNPDESGILQKTVSPQDISLVSIDVDLLMNFAKKETIMAICPGMMEYWIQAQEDNAGMFIPSMQILDDGQN